MRKITLLLVGMSWLLAACSSGGDGGDVSSGSNTRITETIVFTADKETDNVRELYAVQDDGSRLVKLSASMVSGGSVSLFKLSPDKNKVAYLADQDIDNKLELYVVNVDGTGRVKVSLGLGPDADVHHGNTNDAFWWSPDSTRLVYMADTDIDEIQELFLVNADGSDHHKINGNVGTTVRIGQARWSPDSRYVAYFVRSRTPYHSGYAVDRIAINTHDTTIGGNNSIRVSGTVAANQTDWVNQFVWSPDSTRIAYTSYEDASGVRELYIAIAGQTTQQSRVNVPLVASQGVLYLLYWSSDSRYLLYNITGTNPGGLYTHDTQNTSARNGTNITGPLASGRSIDQFAFAPDDSRVAYIADQDTGNQYELYSALPGVTNSRVKLNGVLPTDGGVTDFKWSPDSSRVAYVADQDMIDVLEAYTAAADGGSASVKVSLANLTNSVVQHSRFSWSPDGQYIAYEVVGGDQTGLYVTTPNDNLSARKVSGNDFTSQSRFGYQPYVDDYFTYSPWTSDSRYFIFSASINTTFPSPNLPWLLYSVGIDETQPTDITGSLVTGGSVGGFDF